MTGRRWRCDGPDYLVGSQRILKDGGAAGNGGLVGWGIHGWFAYAWRKGSSSLDDGPEKLFPVSGSDPQVWNKALKKAKAWVEKKLLTYTVS